MMMKGRPKGEEGSLCLCSCVMLQGRDPPGTLLATHEKGPSQASIHSTKMRGRAFYLVAVQQEASMCVATNTKDTLSFHTMINIAGYEKESPLEEERVIKSMATLAHHHLMMLLLMVQ